MPAMRELVADSLSVTLVSNRFEVDFSCLNREPVRRLRDAILATKSEWLRPFDVFWLWSAEIEDFFEGRQDLGSTAVPLPNAATEDQISLLAKRIVDAFATIPRRYNFWFKLEGLENPNLGYAPVAPDMTIIAVSDENRFTRLRELMEHHPTAGSYPDFLRGHTYLRVNVQGYFDGDANSIAFENALARIKRFAGLATASRIVTQDVASREETYHAFAFCLEAGGSRARMVPLPSNIAHYLARLEFDWAGLRELRTPLDESDFPAGVVRTLFAYIFSAMSCSEEAPEVKHLLTAAEWLVDAQVDNNQTNQFLFACIGLEAILLSTKEQTTARLADRLAYLLGRSQAERVLITERFMKFYNTRSDVVHGRARRVTSEQYGDLQWGIDKLKRALKRELETVPLRRKEYIQTEEAIALEDF